MGVQYILILNVLYYSATSKYFGVVMLVFPFYVFINNNTYTDNSTQAQTQVHANNISHTRTDAHTHTHSQCVMGEQYIHVMNILLYSASGKYFGVVMLVFPF